METEIATQLGRAPDLLAIVVIVVFFLKANRSIANDHREQFQEMNKANSDMMERLHEENMEARAQTRQAIEKNSEASLTLARSLEDLRLNCVQQRK